MKVRGAYMTIEQFLHTYKQGIIYTKTDSNVHDTWFLQAGRNIIIPDYQTPIPTKGSINTRIPLKTTIHLFIPNYPF